jgi:hypothetical protein
MDRLRRAKYEHNIPFDSFDLVRLCSPQAAQDRFAQGGKGRRTTNYEGRNARHGQRKNVSRETIEKAQMNAKLSLTDESRGTSISLAESAEAYSPTHKAKKVYPFRIPARLKAVVFCEVG